MFGGGGGGGGFMMGGPPRSFSGFIVDETLSELDQCKRYTQSQFVLQRQIFAQRLSDCARNVGVPDTIKHLLPLLQKLVKDREMVVRQAVAEEVGKLATFLGHPTRPAAPRVHYDEMGGALPTLDTYKKGLGFADIDAVETSEHAAGAASPDEQSPGYLHIKNSIIPTIQTLLVDAAAEVRQAASRSLAQVAQVLTGDDVGMLVLTLVLCLAHDESDEQRITAMVLMNDLAPRLGEELVVNYVALELAAFADDRSSRVRKAAAHSFGKVCQTIGPALTVKKLLPAFEKLSADRIWSVRKGCIDSLIEVAKVVPPETRQAAFLPMFERFLGDTSRWVRMGAFEVLGPFLHVLGAAQASPAFLQHFAQIPQMSDSVVDPEVNYFCAFSFPGVVQAVGQERWGELKECFQELVNYRKFTVRRCLACSLHEMAAVLGTAQTEQYLLPAFDVFLTDLDVVRSGVIKNFAAILAVLSPGRREDYLAKLWEISNQTDHWRWRKHIAVQLPALLPLYPAARVASDLRPLHFALCNDNVVEVRQAACATMHALLERLYTEDRATYMQCLETQRVFQSSVRCQDRQLFVGLCEGMLPCAIPGLVEHEVMPRLLLLARDPVRNVRYAVAKLVRLRLYRVAQWASVQADVTRILQHLAADVDREVAWVSAAEGIIKNSGLLGPTFAPQRGSKGSTSSATVAAVAAVAAVEAVEAATAVAAVAKEVEDLKLENVEDSEVGGTEEDGGAGASEEAEEADEGGVEDRQAGGQEQDAEKASGDGPPGGPSAGPGQVVGAWL